MSFFGGVVQLKNTPVKIGIYCPFDHQRNDVSYEMSIS